MSYNTSNPAITQVIFLHNTHNHAVKYGVSLVSFKFDLVSTFAIVLQALSHGIDLYYNRNRLYKYAAYGKEKVILPSCNIETKWLSYWLPYHSKG